MSWLIAGNSRNSEKTRRYIEKYGYKCMNPDCRHGFNPIVHHIVPLKKGGIDSEENFIILCTYCHYNNKYHSNFEQQEIELATCKYYFESLREYQKFHPEDEKIDSPLIEATITPGQEIKKMQENLRVKPPKAKKRQIKAKICHKEKKVTNKIPKVRKKAIIKKHKRWKHIDRISHPNGKRWVRWNFEMDALTRKD